MSPSNSVSLSCNKCICLYYTYKFEYISELLKGVLVELT